MRRLRVVGKGGRERIVPVSFELAAIVGPAQSASARSGAASLTQECSLGKNVIAPLQ